VKVVWLSMLVKVTECVERGTSTEASFAILENIIKLNIKYRWKWVELLWDLDQIAT
jgi:hypothetical protein